ncbi:hypothetical protein SNE40_022037 [Patella caerulea]|uniref:RRM domain-containing protein n=1 Tax=Patella caerulea TaxID=87958 RepID=A0AAN8IZK9_PATCE
MNSATLYVGDLHPDVSESMLFSKFSTAGSVESVCVRREGITKRSLGYAYVTFSEPADAKQAMSTMNHETMHGRPIRIMWAQGTTTDREDANVFIKNLDKSIDKQVLYDVFSPIGDILSCKIVEDRQGSKGYGYVNFDTEEAAKQAIEKVNGMVLKGKKVNVEKFIPQRERLAMMGDRPKKNNNVYIKNFGHEYDDDKLKLEMEKFGKVISAKVMTDHQNISRGFGFVCFEDPEAAEKCIDNIMGSELNGKILYASPAQKRSERRDELREKFERSMREGVNGNKGVNLYVKNLDSRIDDERLRQEFSEFGTITSVKVMGDGVKSKGFGFVCFSSPKEATKALTEMNGRIVLDRPLYVAHAQRKEERRANLASQRITTMRQQQSAQYSQMFQPGLSGAGCFVTQLPQAARGFFTPTQMQAIPRWQTVVRQPTPWRGDK